MENTVEPIDVRSYRSVFELERRIYRIDRLRLNPSGIPVRSFVYFAALALALVALHAIPVVGAALTLLPWYLRYGGLAAGLAALLTVLKVDGRPSHLAALSLARLMAAPRRLWQLSRAPRTDRRWVPPEILLVPDGSEGSPARLRYRGPGAVLVLAHHRCRVGRRRLWLRPSISASPGAQPRVLAVGAATVVETAPPGDARR